MLSALRSMPCRWISKAKRKSGQGKEVLDRLNRYLNAAEPEPVFYLTRFWSDQQKAVTYKEIREAIQNGFLDEKTLKAWQMDYANFVNERLKPIWEASMQAATPPSAVLRGGFYFDPTTKAVRDWINTRGSNWVTAIEGNQREAINNMLWKGFSGDWTVDELARAIRPTIGLTVPQANANINYYKHVKNSLLRDSPGMKETTAIKRAQEAAAKYASRQHRQRAYTIATTEMAFAYNKGADEAIRQAQEKGYMGAMKRIWNTADDERVCGICGGLDGVAIDMDGEFDFRGRALYGGQKQTPPAHPRCRCVVDYEETGPAVSPVGIGLDRDEEHALKNYISSDSYKINEKLRSGLPLTTGDYWLIAYLDAALSKMPKYEGTLTRSLQFINEEDMALFLRQHGKGNIIEYEQYISTTKGAIYNPSAPVQMLFLHASGGRDISSYNIAEKEIIYERGSRFRVVDINESSDGTRVITMEEYLP